MHFEVPQEHSYIKMENHAKNLHTWGMLDIENGHLEVRRVANHQPAGQVPLSYRRYFPLSNSGICALQTQKSTVSPRFNQR